MSVDESSQVDPELSVPVGCILAYIGNMTSSQLKNAGWALCNGQSLERKDYEKAFGVIGSSYGGDDRQFLVPDYRGFFLRGHDPDGFLDKDVSSRHPETNSPENSVNTSQDWATGHPKAGIPLKIRGVPKRSNAVYRNASKRNERILTKGSQRCFIFTNGDPESRPKNAYVNYIMKIAPLAALQVGTIVPYAGNRVVRGSNLELYYRLCDGSALSGEKSQPLADAIGTAHGTENGCPLLPDYRGYFLRGVSGDSGNDPEASGRTSIAQGGNAQNQLGSVQSFSTGLPRNPFYFDVDINGKIDESAQSVPFLGNNIWIADRNSDSISMAFDSETRPANTSVDFYIFGGLGPAHSDIFPIGGVIGMPSETVLAPNNWIPCNGARQPTDDKYRKLFDAIGRDNGGDQDNYYVPDYRGRFLRGCDHGAGRDPDAKYRYAVPCPVGGAGGDCVGSIQDWATADAKTPLMFSLKNHCPRSYSQLYVAGAGKIEGAHYSEDYTEVVVQGGDSESRPKNKYVKYYIKYDENRGTLD